MKYSVEVQIVISKYIKVEVDVDKDEVEAIDKAKIAANEIARTAVNALPKGRIIEAKGWAIDQPRLIKGSGRCSLI